MDKVWELHAMATKLIKKICKYKCFHLGVDTVENCYDYIVRRIELNDFQALKNYDPSKGAKESTYLHMLIGSRLIDFFNSAKQKREISNEDSINNNVTLDKEPSDYKEILDDFVSSELTFEEQTYLHYRYNDELSYKEIAAIFGEGAKQSSKRVENIQKKLRRKLEKANYSFEDLI